MVHRVFNSAQYLLVNVHHVVNGGQYVNQMARSVDYSAYLVNITLESTQTEMSILMDDKMRPLFQGAIVTKLAITKSTTRYQMKATEIIFPMMPHESLWVNLFGHHSLAKLGIFPK